MSNRDELMQYIESLTSEQVEKLAGRLDLLKQVVAMTEAEAIYTQTLTGKLFSNL